MYRFNLAPEKRPFYKILLSMWLEREPWTTAEKFPFILSGILAVGLVIMIWWKF